MKKFSVKALLLTGDTTNHEHKELMDVIIEGENAQDVKKNLLQNLSIEIQEVDKNGKIILASECKTLGELRENSDCIVMRAFFID